MKSHFHRSEGFEACSQFRAGTAYAEADKLVFTGPIPARNWLQASNPSER